MTRNQPTSLLLDEGHLSHKTAHTPLRVAEYQWHLRSNNFCYREDLEQGTTLVVESPTDGLFEHAPVPQRGITPTGHSALVIFS